MDNSEINSSERREQRVAMTGVLRAEGRELLALARMLTKWTILGSGVGVLAGIASAAFLIALDWATETRTENGWLLYLLPLAGLGIGWAYHLYAGAAARGNNLVVEQVHANNEAIPLRMAPMVLLGTIGTHLFGGSAGREGTAIQMGASLADWLGRRLRPGLVDRRLLLMAGISGGFGSVFGTPFAGFVFGMEVQRVGRVSYEGVIPCLVASVVGDMVTRALGAPHAHYPHVAVLSVDPLLLIRVGLAGLAFGLASWLFIEFTHAVKRAARDRVAWPPLRPALGGVIIIGLTLLVGARDYLGLSLPLIQQSVSGEGVMPLAFLLKLIFTGVTLGTGFLGGEVTPLFVIGSTLGYTLGQVLGIDPALLASIGFVAVFAGASNTPLASAIMGIELFGGGAAIYFALGCFAAYLSSGHRSIYVTQRVGSLKYDGAAAEVDATLEVVTRQRVVVREPESGHHPRKGVD